MDSYIPGLDNGVTSVAGLLSSEIHQHSINVRQVRTNRRFQPRFTYQGTLEPGWNTHGGLEHHTRDQNWVWVGVKEFDKVRDWLWARIGLERSEKRVGDDGGRKDPIQSSFGLINTVGKNCCWNCEILILGTKRTTALSKLVKTSVIYCIVHPMDCLNHSRRCGVAPKARASLAMMEDGVEGMTSCARDVAIKFDEVLLSTRSTTYLLTSLRYSSYIKSA